MSLIDLFPFSGLKTFVISLSILSLISSFPFSNIKIFVMSLVMVSVVLVSLI